MPILPPESADAEGGPRRRRSDLTPDEDAQSSEMGVLVGLHLTPGNVLLDSCDENVPAELDAEDANGSPTARSCLLVEIDTRPAVVSSVLNKKPRTGQEGLGFSEWRRGL
jgi:hypothetical protein